MDDRQAPAALSVAGYYRSQAAFTAAAGAAAREGRHPLAFTPYPVHGLEGILGIKRSLLGRPVLGVILIGFCIGLHMCWFTMSQDWPLNVGGKPYFAWPTFMVVSLETGLLLGALANLLIAAHLCRLFPSPHTTLPNPRMSDDTFALVLPVSALADAAALSAWLTGHGAEEVETYGAQGAQGAATAAAAGDHQPAGHAPVEAAHG
jgi:hypothetical protein